MEVGLQSVCQLVSTRVMADIFESPRLDVDDEGSIVDASIVRAHQDAAGGRRVQTNCLGSLSRRFSTKIRVVVDLRGRPLFVTLTPGQRHENHRRPAAHRGTRKAGLSSRTPPRQQ